MRILRTVMLLAVVACSDSTPPNGAVVPPLEPIPYSLLGTGKIAFERISEDYGGVYVVDIPAKTSHAILSRKAINAPVLSPDGGRIAFTSVEATGDSYWDVFVANADGTNQRRVTKYDLNEGAPAWSADGHRLSMIRSTGAPDYSYRLSEVRVADSTELRALPLSRPETCPGYFGQTEDPVDLSEDGRILMFCSSVELVVLTPDGVRSATYTPPTGSYVMAAAWSPDGSRIAFIEFLGPGEPTRMSLKVIPATMSTAETIFSKELASSSSGRYAGAKNETLCWLAGVDRLVFNIPEQDRLHSHLWVIDLDGNGLTQVTTAPNTTNRSVSCTR